MTATERRTARIQVAFYLFWARRGKSIACLLILLGMFAMGAAVSSFSSAITLARYAETATADKERMRQQYIQRIDAANARIAELGGKAADAAIGAAGAAADSADAAKRAAGSAAEAASDRPSPAYQP